MKGTIYDDTPVIPEIVADAVVRELFAYWHSKGIEWNPPEGLPEKLADRAERVYAKNQRMAKRFRSADGLDWLYTFMRHWLSAEFPSGSALGKQMPYDFWNGRKPV